MQVLELHDNTNITFPHNYISNSFLVISRAYKLKRRACKAIVHIETAKF